MVQQVKFKMDARKIELELHTKEKIEKSVVMEFLGGLPLEGLKNLVSFREIDPCNDKEWEVEENRGLLRKLEFTGSVQYRAELLIEVGKKWDN